MFHNTIKTNNGYTRRIAISCLQLKSFPKHISLIIISKTEYNASANKIINAYEETRNKLNLKIFKLVDKDENNKIKAPSTSKDIIGFELFINWALPLVLVEGSFDAIAVRRNAIPLFGKTISEDLRKKIIENKVSQLYICLDKDAQKQALQHAEYFMNNGVQVYFVDLQEKDPAEIGFENMCSLIKQTPPLTFEKFIEYKLLICAILLLYINIQTYGIFHLTALYAFIYYHCRSHYRYYL